MSILNSAHGGEAWEPRAGSLAAEIGSVWGAAGVSSEVGALRHVLLHRPGAELAGIDDPAPVLWNAIVEPELAQHQHDTFAATYRRLGVQVTYMEPGDRATPNLYFARDLFFMTPQGAIISRMASAARAGEERHAAAALAKLGIPILHTVHSHGAFEGADIVYLAEGVVLVARGLRSNHEGCRQVAQVLAEIGLEPVIVDMPYGTGHIDGGISVIDRRTAIVRPYHICYAVIDTLRRLGYTLVEAPDEGETARGMAINLVPVAPGVVVMPAGNPSTRAALERLGVECHEVDVSELMKGGGAIHCMTGVIRRDPAP
jgi:N-dimethylarginine dimethylaminohydrolase